MINLIRYHLPPFVKHREIIAKGVIHRHFWPLMLLALSRVLPWTLGWRRKEKQGGCFLDIFLSWLANVMSQCETDLWVICRKSGQSLKTKIEIVTTKVWPPILFQNCPYSRHPQDFIGNFCHTDCWTVCCHPPWVAPSRLEGEGSGSEAETQGDPELRWKLMLDEWMLVCNGKDGHF